MVEAKIIAAVRKYLSALPSYGIHPSRGILFGSSVRGTEDQDSDIDLVVIAPEFDEKRTVSQVEQLWLATGEGDDRIEPIPCGEVEWEHDRGRPFIEIARQQGIEIRP